MRDALVPILLIAVVLAVPVVPFVVLGDSFEQQAQRWLDEQLPQPAVAAIVVGLLSTDVLLPIPSSLVNTFAGNQLGFLLGTAAAWAGMTLGSVIGFALARLCGRPLVRRLSSAESLARGDSLGRRVGPAAVVVSRPVPVLAEAMVLLLGASSLSWRRFLVPLALSNLGLAAAYAALGQWVWGPVALAAAIALPLAAATIARIAWPADATD